MDIKFVNPGFQYMLDSIMEFQKDDSSVFWNDSLFYFFKELDKEYAYSLSTEKRREYFEEKLSEVYRANETLLQEKVQVYSRHWNLHKAEITQAFTDAFGVDCSEMFNDLVCNISLNPISPRDLKEHSFDGFYLNSEREALGNALHEIVHFVWFAVWNDLFKDSYEEYENPSLKWILSELVVEAVMSDERLCSVNPYYPREQGGCIYPYNQVEEAISVMREVAKWGREQGFRVWLDEWLTSEELVTDEAKPENFCIGEVDGKIVCAFILQRRDSAYWKDSSDVQAVYLHKLCVRREYAHRNMTKTVIEAIKEECRKNGIKYIRLDTGLDEKAVRKIYLNAGFKIVDIIDFDNGRSMALYELEV